MVVIWWAQLEVDAVFPEEIFEGFVALIVYGESRGLETPVK